MANENSKLGRGGRGDGNCTLSCIYSRALTVDLLPARRQRAQRGALCTQRQHQMPQTGLQQGGYVGQHATNRCLCWERCRCAWRCATAAADLRNIPACC